MHRRLWPLTRRLVAIRNVAFKVARMGEFIMESQDELIMRKSERYETGLEDDKQAALDDCT